MKNIHYIIIILILFIIIFTQRCESSKKYDLLKTELFKQKEIVAKTSKKRIQERDSLNLVISKREQINDSLKNNITSLENKIKTIRDRTIIIPKDLEEFKNYFNKRYNTLENTVIVDKVGVSQTTATNIVVDLEEGDKNSEIIPLKDEQLKNKDSIIVNLENDKENLSILIFSAEKEIEERIKLEALADKSIKTLERKNKWNKLYIVSGIIGSFIVGNQIK